MFQYKLSPSPYGDASSFDLEGLNAEGTRFIWTMREKIRVDYHYLFLFALFCRNADCWFEQR
jgi:hypothetical protein